MCCNLEEHIADYPNESIIEMNAVLDPKALRKLNDKLRQISKRNTKTNPRVVVVGGWTDAHLYHLCYEIFMRCGFTNIASCSAITASRSDSAHWQALAQLKSVMNINVTRTVRELMEWCSNDELYRLPGLRLPKGSHWPDFEWVGAPPSKFNMQRDGEILAYLYRNASRIILKVLAGGYSAGMVLSVQSFDLRSNAKEAPSVVKIDACEVQIQHPRMPPLSPYRTFCFVLFLENIYTYLFLARARPKANPRH